MWRDAPSHYLIMALSPDGYSLPKICFYTLGFKEEIKVFHINPLQREIFLNHLKIFCLKYRWILLPWPFSMWKFTVGRCLVWQLILAGNIPRRQISGWQMPGHSCPSWSCLDGCSPGTAPDSSASTTPKGDQTRRCNRTPPDPLLTSRFLLRANVVVLIAAATLFDRLYLSTSKATVRIGVKFLSSDTTPQSLNHHHHFHHQHYPGCMEVIDLPVLKPVHVPASFVSHFVVSPEFDFPVLFSFAWLHFSSCPLHQHTSFWLFAGLSEMIVHIVELSFFCHTGR